MRCSAGVPLTASTPSAPTPGAGSRPAAGTERPPPGAAAQTRKPVLKWFEGLVHPLSRGADPSRAAAPPLSLHLGLLARPAPATVLAHDAAHRRRSGCSRRCCSACWARWSTGSRRRSRRPSCGRSTREHAARCSPPSWWPAPRVVALQSLHQAAGAWPATSRCACAGTSTA
jgi:hypothetical protein